MTRGHAYNKSQNLHFRIRKYECIELHFQIYKFISELEDLLKISGCELNNK